MHQIVFDFCWVQFYIQSSKEKIKKLCLNYNTISVFILLFNDDVNKLIQKLKYLTEFKLILSKLQNGQELTAKSLVLLI